MGAFDIVKWSFQSVVFHHVRPEITGLKMKTIPIPCF
jgi:hypothetical protein